METPRSKSQANSNRGVRIVGKIRPFLDSESSSDSQNCSQISISRSDGEHATICFGDQSNSKKDCYKLDWCYEKDEDITEVFSKEVKPLLQGILKGINGCVIAHGARGSGKTQLILGSEENPGLAKMAISEIFPAVEKLGGSVSISCYEVCQDRVYDLLKPKEQEVLIMEDAKRRIQLKGLSKVPVKSISDFMKSYFHGCKEWKLSEKGADDVANRSHRGLIIHVSYVDKESNKSHEGKMNFADLAGYEDTKRKSYAKATLNEIARVNKSMYALLNVVCALNSSETYIPYRETKLTRLLQDCLHITSGAVLFTCMNPTACQDTIHAVGLASRSCHVVNKHHYDSAKNNQSGSRFVTSSFPMNGRIRALNASVKKLDTSDSVEKKGYGTLSMMKKSKPQKLSNLKTKAGTSLNFSTAKNVHELSTTKRSVRTMSDLKSPIISPEKVMYSLSQLDSVEKKGYGTSSTMKKSKPQKLSNLKTKVETSLHFSTAKKVHELSTTKTSVKTMSDLKSPIISPEKVMYSLSQLDSVEKKANGTSSMMKMSKPQKLSNLKTKAGTTLHFSTAKKVHELSTTKRSVRTMSDLKSPIVSPEKGICMLGNHKDTQQAMLEGNVPVGDGRHNPLKANHTGSPTPEEQVVFETKENNELQEELDIGLVKLDNDNHDDAKEKHKQTPIPEAGKHSPTLTEQLREISNSLKLFSSKPISASMTLDSSCQRQLTMDPIEPKTPRTPFHLRLNGDSRLEDMGTPQDILKARSTGLKKSLVQECLTFLNSATKEELRELKGIGEKRATYIIKLREETPEPFKEIDDLKDIGISSKQIKGMMSGLLGNF